MAAEKIINVLDSSAMIAYLRQEKGALVVERIMTNPNNVCYAHAINLCEVYYDAIRVGGLADAEKSLKDLFALGVIERSDFDTNFWKNVGQLKANYRASLADFCAIILANNLGGTVLTSDHHEFDKIARDKVCSIKFIR
ncbi:MAG: PIN domain-containing protein [Pyrinomonadaceae bacterium]